MKKLYDKIKQRQKKFKKTLKVKNLINCTAEANCNAKNLMFFITIFVLVIFLCNLK